MKKRQLNNSNLKFKLRKLASNGKPYVVWKLNTEQLKQVSAWGYYAEPYLWKIKTRTFPREVRKQSSFLKQIHYSKVSKGKDFIYLVLSKKDWSLISEHDISARPFKYKIYLQKTTA